MSTRVRQDVFLLCTLSSNSCKLINHLIEAPQIFVSLHVLQKIMDFPNVAGWTPNRQLGKNRKLEVQIEALE